MKIFVKSLNFIVNTNTRPCKGAVTLCNLFCNLSRNCNEFILRIRVTWSGMFTVQRFLQLVSQSFLMLSRTGNYFQMASFYWLLNKNIARQVARGMLHCAMAKKCVAALRQSLRKVEPDSTSCNASCNKNFS